MDVLLVVAGAWPVLLLVIGLLLGRLLRSADRDEEERRTDVSRALALLNRLGRRAGDERRPVPATWTPES